MEKSIKEKLLGIAGNLSMILINSLFTELAAQKMKTVIAYIGHADKTPKEGILYAFESKRGSQSDKIDLVGTLISKDFDKESLLQVVNSNYGEDRIKFIPEISVPYQIKDDGIAYLDPKNFDEFKKKFFEYIEKDLKLHLVTADDVNGTDFLDDQKKPNK